MLVSEIRTKIRSRLDESTADYWSDAEILSEINEAVRRFCNEEKWDWLYTEQLNIPIAATATLLELIDEVVPNKHFNIILKSGTTLLTPKRIPPADGVRIRAQYEGTTGPPRFYYVVKTVRNEYTGETDKAYAQKVRLLPAADKAYTAEYSFIRRPAKLVADGDEPDIPEDYQDAIVALATALLWMQEGQQHASKVDEQLGLYSIILGQAKKDMQGQAIDASLVWGQEDPEPKINPYLPSIYNIPETLG